MNEKEKELKKDRKKEHLLYTQQEKGRKNNGRQTDL